jgi:hypothetical protein
MKLPAAIIRDRVLEVVRRNSMFVIKAGFSSLTQGVMVDLYMAIQQSDYETAKR